MAEESLVTVLGFDAQQAITTLKQLELSLNNYTIAMGRAARVTSRFNKSATNIEGQIKKTDRVIRGFAAGVKKQSTALQSSDKQIKKAGKSLDRLEKQNKKTGKQMILTWQSVIRIFTIQVIHQMISKLTSQLGGAARAASNLEIQLAEIQTIGGPLRGNFEGLADNVQELSNIFGIQTEIVAEGVYQTLSNQVGEAREAFTFFTAAADFSIAAVTSADAAVNLLSSTINAFGYNASQASLLGGKLFKAIELGRIRGEEFANTFGRVAVLAAKLGVSLDEVLASITTLTISGLKYNEAFTLINNVMLKLIRPTEELQGAFDKLGITTIEAGIQAYGFQGLLGKLSEMTGGTATEMGKLFGRVRAVRGALGLTGEAAQKYTEDLQAIREAGPETLFEAKELIFETNAKQVQLEINELRNAVIFDFGRDVLNIINKVIQAFGGLVNIVKSISTGAIIAGGAFVGLMITLHPIGALIIGIGVAVAALTALWGKYTQTQAEELRESIRLQKRAIIEINAAEAKTAELRVLYHKDRLSRLQIFLVEALAADLKIQQRAIQTEKLISGHFNKQLDNRREAFSRFVQTMIKSMERARDNINKTQKTIFALQRDLSQEIYDGQTKSYNETRKAQANLQRSVKLTRQGAQEFKKGHRERADLLFSEARALAEQAKATGENIKNTVIERSARNTIQRIIKDQIGLQQRFIRAEQQRSKLLSEQIPLESARARRIAAIIEKLKEFKIFGEKGEILFPTKAKAMAAVMPLLMALQKELAAAGAKINIFKRLEETGEIDLQKALKKALEPLDAIFEAKKIDITFAYKERIETIFKDIQAVANQIPIEIKFDIEKILGYPIETRRDVETASKDLVEMERTITKSIRSTSELEGKQVELKNQIQNVRAAANATKNAFISQLGPMEVIEKASAKLVDTFTERMESTFGTWNGIIDLEKEDRKQMTEVEKLLGDQARAYETVGEATRLAHEQITKTFDLNKFENAITILSEVAKAQEALGRPEVAEAIRLQIEIYKEAAETLQHIKASMADEAALKRMEEASKIPTEGIKGIGNAAQETAMTSNMAFGSMVGGLSQIEIQAKQTARAIANIISGAATPGMARFGKMIYRQYGGYTPQSTDTVPAMLSPGEFVVNARSTRRFQSQLVAMNAGIQPAFRRMGGSTTTIGDVNISVQGASSPKQTAREMMYAFRREVRRKTSQKP